MPLQFFGFLALSAVMVWRANRQEGEGGEDTAADSGSAPAEPAADASKQLGSSGLALAGFGLGMLVGIMAITIAGGAVAALFGSGGRGRARG